MRLSPGAVEVAIAEMMPMFCRYGQVMETSLRLEARLPPGSKVWLEGDRSHDGLPIRSSDCSWPRIGCKASLRRT